MENAQKARYERISLILGMGKGAANHRLLKSLLFSMAHRLGLASCYRCNKPIETVREFSIEHKEAWEYGADPVILFFNLENIAFSHFRCNCAAASRVKIHADKSAAEKARYDRRKCTPGFAEKMTRRKALRQERAKAKKMVQAQGLEPRSPQSKGGILPLDEA